jgi:O-antigen ligase
VHGWYEHPIVGAGLGAKAADSIRSDERPWEYELYYLALLYQTGLLGLLAYVAGVAWIFWQGLRIIKSDRAEGYLVLPVLVGSACLLLANATNPYLPRFDGLWAIFLPLAHVNSWLVRQKVSASFPATRHWPRLTLTLLRRDRAKPLSEARICG